MRVDQLGQATDNLERLRNPLLDGTLAAKFVDVYRANAPDQRKAALRAIAEQRQNHARAHWVPISNGWASEP